AREVGHVGFRLVGTAWILILHGAQRNRWSVISGGQLIRTSTIEVPAPGDVYPSMPRRRHAPRPMRRGTSASMVAGYPPGKQIWPPCVWPHSITSKPACAA